VCAAFGLRLLFWGEDPVAETVAESLQRPFDAADVAEIVTDPEYH
jgi:hypothetical protein